MPEIEVLLPKMGESVAEATVTRWIAEEGQSVEADEPIVEIATDKVDSEVPVPEDCVIVKRLCQEGDVVKVGEPIAIIRVESAGTAKSPVTSKPASDATASSQPSVNGSNSLEKETEAYPEPVADSGGPITKTGPSGRFYSPLVRNIAAREGVQMAELEQIEGTGAEGRVTKSDILNYLPNRNGSQNKTVSTEQPQKPSEKAAPSAPKLQQTAPAISVNSGDEIIEMDRMRKLIAEHMVRSKQTSPHVTSYVEADVTNLVRWRNKWKQKFEQREGEKLTFTPIFIEAIVRAIKEMPMVNISTDGERIIKRKNINIGMATALPSGNLIVPVIKDADNLNLAGIAKKVNDLANRARINKLSPDEIQGGTYTITNVGSFGNVMGTPIINQPQAAIMAVGAIRKKPAVIETPEGDLIGIRHMMFLSHSYDHRVIDGALGGSFVRKVADYLEQFDVNREI